MRKREESYQFTGRFVDKCLLMGGTFMSLPMDYRDYFMKFARCVERSNEFVGRKP